MENENGSVKRKRIKAWKIFLVVLAAALITVGIWQKNNIAALYIFATNDEAQIQQKLDDVEKKIEEDLESIIEEAEKGSATDKQQSTGSQSEPKVDNSARIQELINEVYSMRSNYIAQLDSMHDTAMHSFWSLPEEQRTMETKQNMALLFIDQAVALEKQCDAKMNEILAELKTLLQEEGRGTAVCDRISRAYAQEKQIKKEELMSILSADPNR